MPTLQLNNIQTHLSRAGAGALLTCFVCGLLVLLSSCVQKKPANFVESPYRSQPQWAAYDAMSPQLPGNNNYFAASFMPVTATAQEGALKIAGDGDATAIYYSAQDAAVVGIAVKALRDDIERVSGLLAPVSTATPKGPRAILIGTLGSPLISTLVQRGKLDVSQIQGKWEAYTAAVIEQPLPGLKKALVIAGSDRRGAAFGVFALSETMGVSPWVFWGDVVSKKKAALYVAGQHTQASPGVKYRGIFINDEDWGLQPWAAKTFEPELGNIGPKTYASVFELLLRLHANTIWPAMHEFPVTSTPFYLHPDNKHVADNYAIVISTSHHEPMLRNSHEYKPDRQGAYDYWENRDTIYNFWQQRVMETANYENIYTMGLRGRDDSGMKAPAGTSNEEKAAKIQQHIIPDQRQMIRDYVHAEPSEIPQIFIPYKETLVQYQSGLQLKDDITIVWPDDNHGYLRQLSTEAERQRAGGSGVYYHLQYWGVPKSYLWLHTTPLGMTRTEMMKAWDFDSRKIWIVNVGDIKPYEIGMEFFLRLARNPEAFRNFNQQAYLRQWTQRSFGDEQAEAVAKVLSEYYRLNIVKRPEHLDRSESGFSFTAQGDAAQQRQQDFAALVKAANNIYQALDSAQQAAFYAMILYPVRASNLANQRVLMAERSRLWAQQGRAATNRLAAEVNAIQQALLDETDFYNRENAGGKWNHIMSRMPLSQLPNWAHETQNAWAMPETGRYQPLQEAALGVAIEGRASTLEAKSSASLPLFNRAAQSRYFIDVFNKGSKALRWRAQANVPWLNLSQTQGDRDTRITVSVNWPLAPQKDRLSASITITGAGSQHSIAVQAYNPHTLDLASLPQARENNGRVVIEAENFYQGSEGLDGAAWHRVSKAAPSGDGVTVLPVTSASKERNQLADSPTMRYQFYAFSKGPVEIHTQTLPTHRITSDHPGARYAISLNGDKPQIIDINAVEYSEAWNINTLRAAAIGKSKHIISEAGVQSIEIWMVDAGLVLDKFTVLTN